MGTKVHCKTYLPGYYSMRDLNEDSSSSSWPLFYGDNSAPTNGQYYNGFMPRNTIDGYPVYDKDALKQKMLEHEAVFRRQVYELHRLYRTQIEMMDEVKRKEPHRNRASVEPSSSSSHQGPHVLSEDARKWHMAGFPLLNSSYGRPSLIPGVEIVNSPLSCTKGGGSGNNTPHAQFPFQNGSTLKDLEALDSRPLKVRKKLFDLQLPAEEYADTEEREKLPESKLLDISGCTPNRNAKDGAEISIKSNFWEHVPSPASCLRNSTGLADLNEPIQIDEAVAASSSIDFLGHNSFPGEVKGINQLAFSNTGHLAVTRDTIHMRSGFLVSSSVESKVNERGYHYHKPEAGWSGKSNISSLAHGLRQDNLPAPSHPVQSMLNPVRQPHGMYSTGYRSEDFWRDGARHDLESSSSRSHDQSNNNTVLEPLVASQAPASHPFFGSSFPGSWPHSVSSWSKPVNNFTQKVTVFDSGFKSSTETDRNLQPSSHVEEHFGGKLPANIGSRYPGSVNEIPMMNGYYHGSASGSKKVLTHPPAASFGYPNNCLRSDNVASDHSNDHGLGQLPLGSKPVIDINLNEAFSRSSSHEPVILQNLSIKDGKRKPEDNFPALPWLKPKPAHGDEITDCIRRSEFLGDGCSNRASSGQLCCKNEAVGDLNQLFTPEEPEIAVRNSGSGNFQNFKKILGVPIFETGSVKNEPSVFSTSASIDCAPDGKNVDRERRNQIIDINLEYEPDEQIGEPSMENEMKIKETLVRAHFDLNSCLSDREDPSPPYCESQRASGVKMTLEIDLEAPVLMDSEDDNVPSKDDILEDAVSSQSVVNTNKKERPVDDVLQNAAEIILSISSYRPEIPPEENSTSPPSEALLAEPLLWFVDAVFELENASVNETRDGSPKLDAVEEIDDFEAMTLQLEETKEEDYMPVPFIPEFPKAEDAGPNTVHTRPRRGQSRRGRQRRDFQRDILPGLASLSRHEVTEDLQTFGGMMKAMGHAWSSGLTRRNGSRNGGGRGRRRAVIVETVPSPPPPPTFPNPVSAPPLVQQLSNIEASLEDRSLTGWGKTTRRPRRQRCPAGNHPTVVST